MTLPLKKVKKAAKRRSASKKRKSSKMITPKDRSYRKASAKKSVSSKRNPSIRNFTNSQMILHEVPAGYSPMRIQNQQFLMNSVTASQPQLMHRTNSWEHILGPSDLQKVNQKQYSQRKSRHCYSSDGDNDYREIIR